MSIDKITKIIILCSLMDAAACGLEVSTTPVGGFKAELPGLSDTHMGVPLHRDVAAASSIQSISEDVITCGLSFVENQWTDEAHYLWFKSGALAGQWFYVSENDATSITLYPEAPTTLEAMGAVIGDRFELIPFWTLETLFPQGGVVPVSSNPFSPVGFLLFYNPQQGGVNRAFSQSFFYHDGSVLGVAGWYDNGNPFGGTQGDTIISPEVYFTVRNQTATTGSIHIAGVVPGGEMATTVIGSEVSSHDNLLVNPYPVALMLNQSGLMSSGAVQVSTNPFNPLEFVLLYDESATGFNPSVSKFYFYHDGSFGIGGAGWYDNDNIFAGPVDDSVALPANAAFTIRKTVGQSTANWSPPLPYNL